MADFNENSGKTQGAGEPSGASPQPLTPQVPEGKELPPPPPSPAEISLAAENFPSPPVPPPPPVSTPSPVLPAAEEVPPSPIPPPFLGAEEPLPQPPETFEPPPPSPSGGEGVEGGEPPPPLPTEVSVSRPKPLIFRILLPVLVALILAGLAFGIWKFVLPLLPAGVKPGGVTLTYWGLWEDANILKPLIDEYESKHKGIKIDYKKQSPKEYRERLQTALSQEKGPDIFRFHNTWLPMLKSSLSPLPGSVFSQDEFKKTFYPVATADLKEGGSLYGIPLEIDGLALLVNTEIFRQANLSPPTTWAELERSARILTVKDQNGKIQTAGAALGITNNVDHWSDILAVMFLQNGADLKNLEGQLAEDVLIYYTSFAQGDSKVWDETLPPSSLAFAQGKVAMIFAPSWEILTIKEKNRSLKLKVLPIPQLPGVNITWASYWAEGISAKSTHQGEAWDFLKYLSQKETLVKFYTTAAQTRLFGEPYARQDLASSLKDDPYLGPYIQQAPQAQSFYLASQTFDNGINDKIIRYFEDTVNAVNRGVSPRGALETADKGVKQVLSTYGVSTSSPKAN